MVKVESTKKSEPREPVGKGRPDGVGGLVDDDGFHYPRADDWQTYNRPQDSVGRNVQVGDIIQCSIPWHAYAGGEPFAWSVLHFRAKTLLGVHTIQTFTDAVAEELGQALIGGENVGIFIGGSSKRGAFAGPILSQNLSSTGDEALSDTVRFGGTTNDVVLTPLRSAAVIVKHTATPGRSGRGRWYFPLITASVQEGGALHESVREFLETRAADFANLNDVQSGGVGNFEMVVWSPTKSASTGALVAYPVTSVSCYAVMGSIRDRVRVSAR